MKRIFYAFIFPALLTTAPVVAQPRIERALQSVVGLEIRAASGPRNCAGIATAPHTILTAAHCADGAVFLRVHFSDGRFSGDVKLVGVDLTSDVAVLQIGERLPALRISRRVPAPGDTVYAIGHPRSYPWTVTLGLVSRVHPQEGLYNAVVAPWIQHSAHTIGGNSGGALLNIHGELVGMVTGGRPDIPFIGIALPIGHVLQSAKAISSKP